MDASAALGIVNRQGVGKLRRVKVQYLWVQSKIQEGDLKVNKIDGKVNPADLMKNIYVCTTFTNTCFNITIRRDDDEDNNDDVWDVGREEVVRLHRRPRRGLFTPLQVRGAPPGKALTPVCVTKGNYYDTGEAFRAVGTWTARATAHRLLPRRSAWTE